MAILGSVLKKLIELKDKATGSTDAAEAQKEELRKLLEKAKDTAFGEYYNFEALLVYDELEKAFAKNVPYFDYSSMQDDWWSRLHKGEKDVTWPGSPPYFAVSSGTTGKSPKRIPVTEEMLESIRKTGIKQVSALANFDLPPEFFEKEILMLSSSTDLEEKEDYKEGEISGISASNIPFWFKGYYKPGEKISAIDDWDERVQKIAENAKDWDIGALSGIPSWIELMLKKIIEHHKLKHIHEIWPNLEVYTSGGVAFKPYEKTFNELLGRPITVIDTYLASEGFLAFQQRPDTDAMKLVTDNGIYFEFVPFKPEYILEDGSVANDAPSLTISEVKEGEEYILVISTVAGAWRYLIGDTIKFTDISRQEIKITGRTKFFLNVVGSQLSVNKMNDAMKALEKKFSIKIPEFTVSAVRIDGEYYHYWYLGTDAKVDTKKLGEALDNELKDANKNYTVARSKALKGLKVETVSPEVFHEWNAEKKKKGGQVKTEKVKPEENFKEWQEFVKNQKDKT